MQFSTTPTLEGQVIVEYCGVVTGEAILGANIFRDFFAGIRDIVGGRSGAYEKELRKRMMADCRKGKIDRILVKSVSRFARNTRDCLSALRELSAMGVSVRFEKENIDTKTLTTELMVSVSGTAVKTRR